MLFLICLTCLNFTLILQHWSSHDSPVHSIIRLVTLAVASVGMAFTVFLYFTLWTGESCKKRVPCNIRLVIAYVWECFICSFFPEPGSTLFLLITVEIDLFMTALKITKERSSKFEKRSKGPPAAAGHISLTTCKVFQVLSAITRFHKYGLVKLFKWVK